MREDKININGKQYPLYIVQTVIVGSGAAGLNAALSLFREGQQDVAIITEGRRMGTSRNAGSDKQTYYKLTTCSGEPDSVRQMAGDLFQGGAMDGDLALVEAALSARSFFHLVELGVPFPHNGAGEYIGYKTDHDSFRRGTSAGPLTSRFMTEALWREVDRLRIPVLDGYQVIEILKGPQGTDERARGIVALDRKEKEACYLVLSSENIIYATGGEAGMYGACVYPVSQTGGMGTALRAGVWGKNLTESQFGLGSTKFRWNLSGTYQQAIPRYISTAQDGKGEEEFLDSYFGDSGDLLHAIFLKGYQWPFDPGKIAGHGSSLIDLLVFQETVMKGRRVFLDYQRNPSCSEKNGSFQLSLLHPEAYEYLKRSDGLQDSPINRLMHMNPGAIELYQSHGIDLFREKLEIAVCAQHGNGGLAGNWWWESNLKHFFPVGEVNGSHGVHRPGGSALNSGQVGGLRAAEYISHCYREPPLSGEELAVQCACQLRDVIGYGERAMEKNGKKGQVLNLSGEWKELGERMSRYGAQIRSLQGVRTALRENRLQGQRIEASSVENGIDLRKCFRLRDILVSQRAYLEAMEDYIIHGGKSRGSCLIYHEQGDILSENLPECFRTRLSQGELGGMVQELEYHDYGSRLVWRKVRPIPEEDCWFEAVWKRYRTDEYFQDLLT